MKDETAINSYELTLTPNYVSDWNFNDALRELIQNGTDQEVLDPDNEFQIDYSQKEKVLRLKNRKSVLKINTLLLGRSSKANNEDTVGQFGEGYKIAALVLNRLGKTFTIYNNEKNEVWESRFKNSEKWLEKILCFYVSKRKTDDHGLCIEVGNVTQGEFNDLYKVWLHLDDCDYSKAETKYGEIILDEAYAGEVAKLLKEEKDKRIKTLTEIPCANVMTLKDKFNRWYDVYAEDIRDEARMEIRNLIDELE